MSGTAPAPRVSIVTPSFNQAKFLEQTIKSVLSQDYPDIEYLIFDGGSNDGSVEIIKKHADRLAYWVSEPDEGQAAAIHKGFAHATGHILAYLNSDDVYLPGAVTAAVETFRQDPSADLVYGDVLIIDAADRVTGERRLCPMDQHDFLGQGNCLAQPATFWTRRIYEKVGGIDPRLYFQMDLDLYLRIARAGGRLRHVRRDLAKIRMHPEGKMSTAESVRRRELATLQAAYLPTSPFQRVWYTRPVLLTRLFIRYALQGDLDYASRKVWRRVLDGRLFRESRG